MEYLLKRAELKDAELLATMRLEMRKERETATCPVSDEEFYRQSLHFFRNGLSNGSFISYIVWDGDQAVACSGLSIQVHPPTYENLTGKHGYITNMYTRPDWRRKGLATLLLDRLVDAAKEAGCAQLFLNASPMGRQVYVHYGFKPVNGEMTLNLKS